MFKDSVLSVACVFSWIKLMHVVKDSSLRIAQFGRFVFPLGNKKIIHKEQHKEIGAWRAEMKVGDKPRFLVSICEDYNES